jgi:lipopolysaccharide export system ATP-binding protein
MSLLKVSGLRKKYKSRTVVKDVSFEVGSGEVVGLLGPNGAGKTTCFYMIVGLVAPTAARSTSTASADAHADPPRARLGLSYLPQEISVFRKLNVAENIRAVLELQNRSPRSRSSGAWTNCWPSCTSPTCARNTAISLSGGERRRVEIARALATARASSCSTSPSPASTRSPCSTSRRSSASSRSAASAC